MLPNHREHGVDVRPPNSRGVLADEVNGIGTAQHMTLPNLTLAQSSPNFTLHRLDIAGDLAALSQACEAAFASHRNDECQRLAHKLSQAAAVQGLRSFEARGLLRQAQCALRDGRFADAMEAAQRAALLHEMTGDSTGEIKEI